MRVLRLPLLSLKLSAYLRRWTILSNPHESTPTQVVCFGFGLWMSSTKRQSSPLRTINGLSELFSFDNALLRSHCVRPPELFRLVFAHFFSATSIVFCLNGCAKRVLPRGVVTVTDPTDCGYTLPFSGFRSLVWAEGHTRRTRR